MSQNDKIPAIPDVTAAQHALGFALSVMYAVVQADGSRIYYIGQGVGQASLQVQTS